MDMVVVVGHFFFTIFFLHEEIQCNTSEGSSSNIIMCYFLPQKIKKTPHQKSRGRFSKEKKRKEKKIILAYITLKSYHCRVPK